MTELAVARLLASSKLQSSVDVSALLSDEYDEDESLDLSARSFLEADLAVDGPTLTCTKLLDWYGPDFGPDARAVVERVRSLLPAATPLHESLGGALGLGTE